MVGGIPTPLKNDGVRQLGWWHFQYDGKVIQNSMVPVTTNQIIIPLIIDISPTKTIVIGLINHSIYIYSEVTYKEQINIIPWSCWLRAINIHGSNVRKTPRISETTHFDVPFVERSRLGIAFLMKKTQESYEKPLKSAPFLPGGSWDIYGPKKISVFASFGRYPDQQAKLWRSSRPPHKMRPPPREHWWVNTSELFLGGTSLLCVIWVCLRKGHPSFYPLVN